MSQEIIMPTVQALSIAALLGVRPRKSGPVSPFDLADAVAKGLSVDAVDRLCAAMAPADPSLRYQIVPKATLARRQRTRRLSRDESERLARLARIWAFALDIWQSEATARRFLGEPHPLLAGRIPRDLAAETEIGAREVEGLLGRLRYGSAV
jgi:putative toxin-antitoxin system antitoxin component (TIGR02293 family)